MRSIRRGTKADVPFLRALEAAAFEPHRRSSPAVLRRHFASPRQTVWILDDAALVLWNHKQFLRLYSLAVHPDAQGKGLGAALMQHAHELAKKEGKKTVLEVEATNQRLLHWYHALGYRLEAQLRDYYGPGRHAIRMVRKPEPA